MADYAEALVVRALNLELAPAVVAGYDARDPATGLRYQVKARRLTDFNRSRQLGFLRQLDAEMRPFDELVGILFERDFAVLRAALIPFEIVRSAVTRVDYVGAWRLILREAVWDLEGVTDVTQSMREAARSWV